MAEGTARANTLSPKMVVLGIGRHSVQGMRGTISMRMEAGECQRDEARKEERDLTSEAKGRFLKRGKLW